jgi:hypothetical protein
MKNLWLLICICLLLAVGLTSNAPASETRVFSMGQSGLFMHDNSNIRAFPGTIMQFNSEVLTELRFKDNEALYSAEVRLPFNNYVFGINFNRPIIVRYPGEPSLILPSVGQNIVLNSATDLYFGTEVGGNDLGIRLSFGADGFNQDSIAGQPKVEETTRYLELAGGYTTDMWDASVSIELPSAESEIGGLKDEASGTIFNLKGRYFYEYNSKMKFIPVAQLGFGSGTQKTDQGGGQPRLETDLGLTYINLGVGVHYEINANSILIIAIDPFGYSSFKQDVKTLGELNTTTTTFPRLYLGGETSLRPWITARIGANRGYQKIVTEVKPEGGTATETSSYSSPYNVSFGLGLKFANFIIDLDINDGILFEGPNFISGSFRDFSNRVSVTYVFGNEERSK